MGKRGFALLLCLASASAAWAADLPAPRADGWVTHPDRPAAPIVLVFQRELELDRVPAKMPVDVTADNRFILYVNGQVKARGPSTGTLRRWRVATVDLAPGLKPGRNVIYAVVWNFGQFAPLAQQSVATGFRLTGADIGTDRPGWKVAIEARRSAVSGSELLRPEYYVASAPEVIDTRQKLGAWRDAIPAPEAAARTLAPDPLPPQSETLAPPGEVVRASFDAAAFPRKGVTIPARTSAYLLLRRDAMISGYPELTVTGGREARIKVTYSEALYDADKKKGDRDLVENREPLGIHDTFIAGGGPQTFAPLWWRTWRFMKLEVTTADEPLLLDRLSVRETGYPFERIGRFESDDAELNRIFAIGWRTLRVDAHETFMDSSFWEQLQYAGDTRLEMLITYAMGGDPRLALQAIDAFAESNVEGGIMEGAYPSRGRNVITTFSLAWIAMLHDWARSSPMPNPSVAICRERARCWPGSRSCARPRDC